MVQYRSESDSDLTSLDLSSPRSSKPSTYYCHSSSRESSHDGDRSSVMQETPACNTPMESPCHSRGSSESRFSGFFSYSSWKKGTPNIWIDGVMKNDKGWPHCGVIREEGGDEEEDLGEKMFRRRCQMVLGVSVFLVIFGVFCLILLGVSRPYRAQITVKSLTVHNFYIGEGSDATGVATKVLTMNSSLKMTVYNEAGFFGIHVCSTPINVSFLELPVAKGRLKKYYQPRNSWRTLTVAIGGSKVPLYGAGGSLALLDSDGLIPLTLKMEVRSQGNVVWKLVRTQHRKRISCVMAVDPHALKTIKLDDQICIYD